ncbi:MAG: hypothetical protein JW720_04555 [Sedimentisphaerales bacterium]|nr:hypothetical protein [Sedimentisphaerales bacterium]
MSEGINRRDFLEKAALVSGAAAALCLEEKILLAGQAGRTGKPDDEPPGNKLPRGRIGKLEVSRIICGGNLLNGFAHSRDLIYVSELLRHYFTDEKIMQTWELCEENGINTMVSTVNSPYASGQDPTLRVIEKYRNQRGGKIQWLAQCFPQANDFSRIKIAADNGADGAFVQGQMGDIWAKHGRVDLLAKAVDLMKENGMVAGVACHDLAVPIALEKEGVPVDFYMKTLHDDTYWSATAEKDLPRDGGLPAHDNMWCTRAEETIEFMRTVKKPWIAYKVLAAGAIHPMDGFKYVFAGGADFACVGMLDFHVVENSIIARRVVTEAKERPRPWC